VREGVEVLPLFLLLYMQLFNNIPKFIRQSGWYVFIEIGWVIIINFMLLFEYRTIA